MKKIKRSVKFMKNIIRNNFGDYILSWGYVLFIGLFGFDEKVLSLGFLVHQIPFLILVIISIISLKYRKIGGILYIIMFAVFTVVFKTYRELGVFMLISLPLLILGLIFVLKKTRNRL